MTCDPIRDRLSAALDGELAPEEAGDVRRHLESCPDCGRKAALLRQTRDAFRAAAIPGRFPRPVALAAVAGILVLALVAGRSFRQQGAPAAPKSESAVFATAARSGVRPAGASDTIDCGLPGATVCLVDRPCADDRCAPRSPGLVIP